MVMPVHRRASCGCPLPILSRLCAGAVGGGGYARSRPAFAGFRSFAGTPERQGYESDHGRQYEDAERPPGPGDPPRPAESVVEREAAGTGCCNCDRGRDDQQVVLVAARRVEVALLPVDG